MLTRTVPVLALESNGLRCLLRLGFGTESDNYAASYRSVQEAIGPDISAAGKSRDYDWLIAAHQLLRRHGQTICRRTRPECNACPLAPRCPAAVTSL